MGKSILLSLTSMNPDIDFCVVDPNAQHEPQLKQVFFCDNFQNIPKRFYNPNYILFAIKPQISQSVIPNYKKIIAPYTVIISIMAGTLIRTLEQHFSIEHKIVRIMPNIGAKIKKSVNVTCFNEAIDNTEKKPITKLLKSFGEVIEINENQINIATALSGSGPAFVLFIIKSFIESATKLGLTPQVAKKMLLATFDSSVDLAKTDDLETLIHQVTSKGGTTEAGLQEAQKDDVLKNTIDKIINASYNRANDLG